MLFYLVIADTTKGPVIISVGGRGSREVLEAKMFLMQVSRTQPDTIPPSIVRDSIQDPPSNIIPKSTEDMILALAGQFKQLSHEPEKFR